MGREIYVGIGIEVLGNGTGVGLQMTGVINPIVGWMIIGVSTIIGLLFIGHGIRARSRVSIETEFNFEFNDSSVTTKDGRILLGVTFIPVGKATVETLQLEYNDNQFRPIDWQPIEVKHSHSKNYTFDLNGLRDIADGTLQEAVFVAKVNGKKFRSLPFNIYKLL